MSGIRDAIADIAAEEPPTVEFDELDDELEEEPDRVQTTAHGSMLDGLRARARQLQAEKTIDLPLPGYSERLWARYGAVSLPKALADANEVNPIIPKWTLAADTLARAVQNIYGRNDRGALEPLDFEAPTRFDSELADLLDLDYEEASARAVLVALCGGEELGQSRLWAHYLRYQGWLMAGSDEGENVAQEVVNAVVGEFPAA